MNLLRLPSQVLVKLILQVVSLFPLKCHCVNSLRVKNDCETVLYPKEVFNKIMIVKCFITTPNKILAITAGSTALNTVICALV